MGDIESESSYSFDFQAQQTFEGARRCRVHLCRSRDSRPAFVENASVGRMVISASSISEMVGSRASAACPMAETAIDRRGPISGPCPDPLVELAETAIDWRGLVSGPCPDPLVELAETAIDWRGPISGPCPDPLVELIQKFPTFLSPQRALCSGSLADRHGRA